jgi:hypothetical protein
MRVNPLREILAALSLPSAMTTSWAGEYVAVIDTSSTKSMDVASLGVDVGAFGYDSRDEAVRGLRKDLNGDGVDEVVLQGSVILCGTGGCTQRYLRLVLDVCLRKEFALLIAQLTPERNFLTVSA